MYTPSVSLALSLLSILPDGDIKHRTKETFYSEIRGKTYSKKETQIIFETYVLFSFALRSSLQRPESSVDTAVTRPAVCDPSTASRQDRLVQHLAVAAQVGVGRVETAAGAGEYSGVKGHPPHSSRRALVNGRLLQTQWVAASCNSHGEGEDEGE